MTEALAGFWRMGVENEMGDSSRVLVEKEKRLAVVENWVRGSWGVLVREELNLVKKETLSVSWAFRLTRYLSQIPPLGNRTANSAEKVVLGEKPIFEVESQTLCSEIASVSKEYARDGTEYASAGEEYVRVSTEYARVSAEYASAGKEYASASTEIASVSKEYARVSTEYATVSTEIATASKETPSACKEIASASSEIESANGELLSVNRYSLSVNE